MINHNSSTPLYVQLANILEEAIRKGDYKDGGRLPSENSLCREYQVSRITVRQAFQILAQKNLVYSVHGKGTFVKIPVISHSLLKIVSFGKTLEQKGLEGYTEIESFEPLVRDKTAEKNMKCDRYGNIGKLCLVGYAYGTPMVFYQSYLRESLAQSMYDSAKQMEREKAAFSTYDLYTCAGIKFERINQEIKAINSDKKLSITLKVPVGTALLILESMVYDTYGIPLEHKISYYRSDKYAFNIIRDLS